jgi:hypothetical protein
VSAAQDVEQKAGDLSARLARSGRGHRPGPSGWLPHDRQGARAPAERPPWAGPGAGLRCAGCDGHVRGVPQGRGKRGAFPDPARSGGGTASLQWQGPSPLPQRHAVPCPAGGQSPRPAPAPPPAGASRPPGRALAFVAHGPDGLRGTVARGRGNAVRFLFPPGVKAELRRGLGRGHRPCHSATLAPGQPGAKAPGQRPPRPRRALLARRVGRWPIVVPGPADLQGTFARGRGKRGAFPFPARSGESTLTAAMAGAIAPATAQRWHQASRGPKPPASARPATGGRFSPAGSGAGLRCAWT